jgi:hypothetical protein
MTMAVGRAVAREVPGRHETQKQRQHERVRQVGATRLYGLLVRMGRAWFRGWTLYVASIRER